MFSLSICTWDEELVKNGGSEVTLVAAEPGQGVFGMVLRLKWGRKDCEHAEASAIEVSLDHCGCLLASEI